MFNDHVREQLPWYDLATYGVRVLGSHYLPRKGRIIDIGASNGNMARTFADLIEERDIDFTSIEASKEMAKTFNGPGRLVVADACDAALEGADLVISFLTMIFIPTHKRGELIRRIKEGLRPGGAFILVERTMPDSGYPSLACARLTLAQKQKQGASPASIFEKEMSLIGLQRPIDRSLFIDNGFHEWFRMGNFSGFIYEAPENL